MKLINEIIKFYEKHFKHHCPDCDGVMDSIYLDMNIDKLVYKCRVCSKEWIAL